MDGRHEKKEYRTQNTVDRIRNRLWRMDFWGWGKTVEFEKKKR